MEVTTMVRFFDTGSPDDINSKNEFKPMKWSQLDPKLVQFTSGSNVAHTKTKIAHENEPGYKPYWWLGSNNN